jgi:acyl-CoA synthetase (AMP-forming)/AMP-acid ligase II
MLSHGNLMENMRAGRDRYGLADGMNGVFWIPPYHDMGLIGGIFTALLCGGRTRLFSPYSFMRDPLRWLHAISAHKASVSAAPDFAYAMAARAGEAAPERIAEWDLSSWRVAISGAEPVRHSTIENFCRTFAPAGFRKDAFHPSFGLAESTLLVTAEPAARTVARLDARELEQHRVRDAAPGATVRTLVGCGAGEQQVAVVDPVTRARCAEDAVGEIWVRGDSVAQGYWGRPQESEEVFRATLGTGEGPFLRTGDLGFLRDGCLFVAGRAKDLIVVRGRNHHPQDLEQTCEEAHPQVRTGRCVAFSVDTGEDERLVLALEVRPSLPHDVRQEIAGAIRERVGEFHDISVHEIVFVPHGGIRRTSSGKLQRSQVRAAYLAGEFETAGRAESRYIAPRDDVERAVAEAWSRCLGVTRVGIHDGFFSLGGDSLKAAGLLGELSGIAGHRLTMADIATAHTVAELAEVLRRRAAHEQDVTAEIHVDLG